MHKIIRNFSVFATLCILSFGLAESQSLKLVDYGRKIYSPESENVIALYSNVENIANTNKNVKLRLDFTLAEGHTYSLCFGESCFPPENGNVWDKLQEPEVITPGDTVAPAGLALDIYPNGVKGYSKVKVTYYIAGSPSDNATFDAEFFAGVSGINDSEPYTVSLFPNPATNAININLKSASEISFYLYDMLGNVVREMNLNEGSNVIDVNNLPNGEYFYSLKSGLNSLNTSKSLIIAR